MEVQLPTCFDVESIISPFSLILYAVSRHEACLMLALCIDQFITFPKPEKLGKKSKGVQSASSLKFRIHVVDNLIPTLIGSVAAGQKPGPR